MYIYIWVFLKGYIANTLCVVDLPVLVVVYVAFLTKVLLKKKEKNTKVAKHKKTHRAKFF